MDANKLILKDSTATRMVFIIAVAIFSFLSIPTGAFLLIGIILSPLIRLEKTFIGKLSKYFLNTSIILLGFGLSLKEVYKVGIDSFPETMISVSLTLTAGYLLTRWFKLEKKLGYLIAVGTAICGGSAIAAISEPLQADRATVGQSTLVVFLLNSIALFVFPHLGHLTHMSQDAFGMWAALAIHDTSSVVGAASAYGQQALQIAITTKLVRSLWIIPIAFLVSFLNRSSTNKLKLPWFILGFIAAATMNFMIPSAHSVFSFLSDTGHCTLGGALFLIGCQMDPTELRKNAVKMISMGTTLWILVSTLSAFVILHWIQ